MKPEEPPNAAHRSETPREGARSRSRIAIKLGCVFGAGWFLGLLQTGFSRDGLTAAVLPVTFGLKSLTSDYDMAVVCLAVTAVTTASVIFSIVRRKLVGISYAAIVVCWLWTYCLLAIPF